MTFPHYGGCQLGWGEARKHLAPDMEMSEQMKMLFHGSQFIYSQQKSLHPTFPLTRLTLHCQRTTPSGFAGGACSNTHVQSRVGNLKHSGREDVINLNLWHIVAQRRRFGSISSSFFLQTWAFSGCHHEGQLPKPPLLGRGHASWESLGDLVRKGNFSQVCPFPYTMIVL